MKGETWYKQARIQGGEGETATSARLLIDGTWEEAIIQDQDGKTLSFPCELKAGELYYFVAKEKKRA